jgi:hypothetical protein
VAETGEEADGTDGIEMGEEDVTVEVEAEMNGIAMVEEAVEMMADGEEIKEVERTLAVLEMSV